MLPPGGRAFLDRGADAPGIVKDGGVAVAAFEAIGWKWGGKWTGATLDYQHFSANGR